MRHLATQKSLDRRPLLWVISVGGQQRCPAVNAAPNSDRKFKGLASVAVGQQETHALQKLSVGRHFVSVPRWRSKGIIFY
jgi:hypothetical protein